MKIPVGIHLGIPDEVYHSYTDEVASNSMLGKMQRSPAHMKAAATDSTTRKAAYLLGSACHSIILEADSFESTWGRAPDGDRRTKAIKDEWAELIETYGQDYVLTNTQYEQCLAVRDAVAAHSTANALLSAEGESEVTLVWDDPRTGVRCKSRIDRLPTKTGWGILDLKTTKDASKKSFAKSLFAYGYFRQAAMYRQGLEILGDKRHTFTFICVEKEKPFGVAVYRIDDGSIDAGEMQLQQLLDIYKSCSDAGYWPAYPDEIQDIAIPPWAFPEIDKEQE